MKSIYLKAYLHIFCSFNIACLYIYISFHILFTFTHSFISYCFFVQFFFSFHITFLFSFSDLLYSFVADFAFFKTVLEGVYLWAEPEWLILHESTAQTVLLSNDILFSVTIFRTMLNTLSELALLWGMHSKAFISFGSSLNLMSFPTRPKICRFCLLGGVACYLSPDSL